MTRTHSLYRSLKANRLVRVLGSLRLTLVGLSILFALTLVGTIFQVDNGLYAAQQRFFESWIARIWYVPLPGAPLVLLALIANLLLSMVFGLGARWSNLGLYITHIGLILLLIGGFQSQFFAQESLIKLWEGEETRTSVNANRWELAMWKESGGAVERFPLDSTSAHRARRFFETDFSWRIEEHHINSQMGLSGSGEDASLEPLSRETDSSFNTPGLKLAFFSPVETPVRFVLHGALQESVQIDIDEVAYQLVLRREQYALPVAIRLNEFDAEFYEDTEIPRSFTSHVVISHDEIERKATISMNEPLRHLEYTFYQSAYDLGLDGKEATILAVVRNRARSLPYLSTALVFFGMAMHFLVKIGEQRSRRRHEALS